MTLRRNLELKARCDDLDDAHACARELGAVWTAHERQRDTFFHAREGRLKLREITRWPGGADTTTSPGTTAAELIWYHRPDADLELRTSAYHLVPAPDPAALAAALAAALGVRGVVEKARTILLWRHVRIHLDRVAGLGAYIEFEAVLGPDLDEAAAVDHLATLQRALRLREADRVAGAYADLLGL